MLSLAATLPMMAGRIDLTVGFGIVMWHILAISLQVTYGVPWPLAIVIVIACAGLVGLLNGVLVEIAQVDAFIATLGTGTILYALALWHTEGRQIMGTLAPGFIAINTTSVAGIPIPALYVLGLAIVLWLVSERLPIGRYIYAIGANEKAAALNGIPVRTYVIGGVRRLGRHRGTRRLRPRREAQNRSGECRPRLSCCPPSSARSSARRPSSRAASTSGARCSASSFSRSAFPASNSSAERSSSNPSSTARPWSFRSRSPLSLSADARSFDPLGSLRTQS